MASTIEIAAFTILRPPRLRYARRTEERDLYQSAAWGGSAEAKNKATGACNNIIVEQFKLDNIGPRPSLEFQVSFDCQ